MTRTKAQARKSIGPFSLQNLRLQNTNGAKRLMKDAPDTGSHSNWGSYRTSEKPVAGTTIRNGQQHPAKASASRAPVERTERINDRTAPLKSVTDSARGSGTEQSTVRTKPTARKSTGGGRPVQQSNAQPTKLSGSKVKIDGKSFTINPTFETFWKYTSERNIVEENRRLGKPPHEWSKKRVFRDHKFCSVFRVADRGCQFLITEVVEKGSQEEVELLFRVLLYSSFVRIETYRLLEEKLGPLTWKTYDRKKYSKVLRDAQHNGEKIYTGAFQKHAPRLGNSWPHDNHLLLLEAMMSDDLLGQLKECEYMADAFDVIYQYPGSGDFVAFQLLINLSYTPLVNFSEDDFVIAGVGAVKGLKECFSSPDLVNGSEPELIRWMTETQEEHFTRLCLKPATLGKEKRRMTLVDVEHTLCELQKYTRILRHEAGHGRRFTPKTAKLSRWPALPRAWAHPARTKSKVKPGRLVTERPEKVYIINEILDRDETEDGEVIYYVDWLGYDASARTWESAESLMADAPEMVKEYEQRHPREKDSEDSEDEPKRKKRKM